jgi:hypothetical protein
MHHLEPYTVHSKVVICNMVHGIWHTAWHVIDDLWVSYEFLQNSTRMCIFMCIYTYIVYMHFVCFFAMVATTVFFIWRPPTWRIHFSTYGTSGWSSYRVFRMLSSKATYSPEKQPTVGCFQCQFLSENTSILPSISTNHVRLRVTCACMCNNPVSSVTRHRRLLDIVGYSTSSVTRHRRLLDIVGYSTSSTLSTIEIRRLI